MTRNEVLEEFRSDACDCECEAWACIVDQAMADEIVRLRQVEQDRAARRAAREPIHSLYDILVQLSEENDDLIEERNRLRAILAMLREPSDDLIDAASRAFTTAMTGDGDWYAGDQWGSIAKALAAALTTAEQEVSA